MTSDRVNGNRGRAGGTSGVLLLLVSGIAFSTAGFFARMAPVPLWSMVFWRNLFGSAGLAALMIARRSDSARGQARLGGRSWAAMGCAALATVCYLAAFTQTSVANISIIYASAPMVTAALAWSSLGERPAGRTLVAATTAFAGVAITVAGSASRGMIAGDALALLMTIAYSGFAVLARDVALPPLATALGSALLAAVAVLPPALVTGETLRVGIAQACWLAAFGLVTMSVALPAYLAGAARVPAARAMLISAVEMPFAPLWVWLAFGEVPPLTSMAGGTLVLAAVVGDIVAASP